MSKARSLVLTSRVESFALVIVEAMLCGAVPVSVDCPFGPGEILDAGKYGILVPPDDPQSLADAMWRIACDDESYLGLQKLGLERAQQYDISRIILEWESIFATVKRAENA
jgi:glycosyltransferase involved in cell wall biosynthesis